MFLLINSLNGLIWHESKLDDSAIRSRASRLHSETQKSKMTAVPQNRFFERNLFGTLNTNGFDRPG